MMMSPASRSENVRHRPAARKGWENLVARLRDAPDEAGAWEAAKALLGAAEAAESREIARRLEAILEGPVQAPKREALVFALGMLGQSSSVPALSRLLRAQESPLPLRQRAAEALCGIEGAEAVAELLRSLPDLPIELAITVSSSLVDSVDRRWAAQLEGLE